MYTCEHFFQGLTGAGRVAWAKETKRCFGCLDQGHQIEECTRKRKCRHCAVAGLPGDHNSVLHTIQSKKGGKPHGHQYSSVAKEGSSSELSESETGKTDKKEKKDDTSKKTKLEKASYPTSLAQGVVTIRNPLNGKQCTVNAF